MGIYGNILFEDIVYRQKLESLLSPSQELFNQFSQLLLQNGHASVAQVNALKIQLTQSILNISKDYLTNSDKTELENKIKEEIDNTLEEINNIKLTQRQTNNKVDYISKDYLTNSDKEYLKTLIKDLSARITAISSDYLVKSDKTELEFKILNEKTRATNQETKLDNKIKSLQNQHSSDKADMIEQINDIQDSAKDAIDQVNQFISDSEATKATLELLESLQSIIGNPEDPNSVAADFLIRLQNLEAILYSDNLIIGDVDSASITPPQQATELVYDGGLIKQNQEEIE